MKNNNDSILHLTINGEKYKWHKQYISDKEIRELGRIPIEDEIFLQIKEPWKDELIENNSEVDLARPGLEHFFSKEPHREVLIIVNGTPNKWDKPKIDFKEVIILAFGVYNDNPNWIYTVGYEDGPKENPEGSMIKGQEVFVKNKMIFHAKATDQS